MKIFEILNAASITGTFSAVDGSGELELVYEGDAVVLRIVTPPVPANLNGDGSVGFGDLLILLASWGACPPPPAGCPADLDGSGDVGFSDLLILLANWS